MSTRQTYRGRFAPTPSGPLHLGSLLTAVASYLQARSQHGAWLLRIDDLDHARCRPGTEAQILRQLEGHGLRWDETPRRQSECLDEYRTGLDALSARGLTFLCTCTRQQLKAAATAGPDGPVYPGTCRDLRRSGRGSVRLRVPDADLCFEDGWQGRQCRQLERDVGDFVVRRANGEYAYQLACAIDEHAQRVSEVVRGADLLGSTFQQRLVQDLLQIPAPAYRHLPVLVDARGHKLSKQNHAVAVEVKSAAASLHRCLELLGQQPPHGLLAEAPATLLEWGAAKWDAAKVPRTAQIAA